MNFASSSQLARWTFSKELLAERRSASRALALKAVDPAAEEPLTVEEERVLLRYYEKSISAFCQQQSYPLRVQSTALIYLKRFYIDSSVLSQDPSKLFIACIYVASKVEEEYLSIDSLTRVLPNLAENQLRRSELKLVKALRYDLIVHTPFKDIDGLTEDISRRMKNGEFEKTGLESFEELSSVRKSAYVAAQCLLETDAPLIFPPSKLALAAVRSGYRSNKKRLDAYLEHNESSVQALQQELSEIDRLGVEGSQKSSVQTEHVQRIDRQLKTWFEQTQKTKGIKDKQQQ